MKSKILKISLLVAAVLLFTSAITPAFAKSKMWKVYMIEAESSIQSKDYGKARESVDKAIELLQGQDNQKALSEAYYLKAASIVYADTDPALAEKYIWLAVKAAPMEPMPKKEYLADPRIAEYRESVLSFLAMEAEQIIQYSKDLLEAEEYCRAKRMLQKVMPYCNHNCMLAETMLEIADSECPDEPEVVETEPARADNGSAAGTAAGVAAGAVAGAATGAAVVAATAPSASGAATPSAPAASAPVPVATAPAAPAPVAEEAPAPVVEEPVVVTIESLAGNHRIGVLPIHFSGVDPTKLVKGMNADWVNAIQGIFHDYKVETVTGLEPAQLKEQYGLTGYSDFLVRGWQVKVSGSLWDTAVGDGEQSGVDFGGLPGNLRKAMEAIMLHGDYEYIVVAKLEATQTKEKRTFQINLYHSTDLSESAATAYKRTTGKFMNRYYNGAAEDLLEDLTDD